MISSERPIDVLVLGGAGVDTIVYVPQLPLPAADSYMVPSITARAGQTGDGVALGTHALGLRTHHLDMLGDDYEGSLVRALHAKHGVPLTTISTPAGTKRAVNLVDPEGRRLSLYDITRGDEADRFPDPVIAELAAGSRHAHVSITYPCAHAMDALRDAGVTLSTDLHDWDGEAEYHRAFADAADLVFLSAAALVDTEVTMRRILANGHASTVVATAGAAGSYVLTRADDVVHHVRAVPPPAPVVDSNGAGDAFVAGFLYAWLRGEPPLRCAAFGAVSGAHACTVPSAAVAPIDQATLTARVLASESGIDRPSCTGRVSDLSE